MSDGTCGARRGAFRAASAPSAASSLSWNASGGPMASAAPSAGAAGGPPACIALDPATPGALRWAPCSASPDLAWALVKPPVRQPAGSAEAAAAAKAAAAAAAAAKAAAAADEALTGVPGGEAAEARRSSRRSLVARDTSMDDTSPVGCYEARERESAPSSSHPPAEPVRTRPSPTVPHILPPTSPGSLCPHRPALLRGQRGLRLGHLLPIRQLRLLVRRKRAQSQDCRPRRFAACARMRCDAQRDAVPVAGVAAAADAGASSRPASSRPAPRSYPTFTTYTATCPSCAASCNTDYANICGACPVGTICKYSGSSATACSPASLNPTTQNWYCYTPPPPMLQPASVACNIADSVLYDPNNCCANPTPTCICPKCSNLIAMTTDPGTQSGFTVPYWKCAAPARPPCSAACLRTPRRRGNHPDGRPGTRTPCIAKAGPAACLRPGGLSEAQQLEEEFPPASLTLSPHHLSPPPARSPQVYSFGSQVYTFTFTFPLPVVIAQFKLYTSDSAHAPNQMTLSAGGTTQSYTGDASAPAAGQTFTFSGTAAVTTATLTVTSTQTGYQLNLMGFFFLGAISPPPGPLPTLSITPAAAFSTRYVVPGYSGPVMKVRNGATGATTDVYPTYTANPSFIGGSYDLITATGASYSSWIGTATGYVTKWCARATSALPLVAASCCSDHDALPHLSVPPLRSAAGNAFLSTQHPCCRALDVSPPSPSSLPSPQVRPERRLE